MKINLRVINADGSAVDVDATTADQVFYEETYSRSVLTLADDLYLRDACFLAWRSLTRQGKTTADFTSWLESIDGVELVNAEEPVPLAPESQPTSE